MAQPDLMHPFMLGSAGKVFGNFALDSSTDELWAPFTIKTTDDITHLGYSVSGITGTPPVYQISMEGVDSSGNPDGTPKCSATWTPTASNWEWRAVSAAYTPTYGERVIVRIKYSSGTINSSNCATFRSTWQGASGLGLGDPYFVSVNSGTPTRTSNPPVLGYKTASTIYGFPITAIGDRAYNSSTGTNKYANKVRFSPGVSGTYTVLGLMFDGCIVVSGNSFDVKVYSGGNAGDTSSTTLRTYDTDYWQVSGGSGRVGFIEFDQAYTCNFDSWYRWSIEPSTTGNITIDYFDVATNADFEPWGWGVDFYQSERSTGNWTDTDTRRLSFYPMIPGATITGSGSFLLKKSGLILPLLAR